MLEKLIVPVVNIQKNIPIPDDLFVSKYDSVRIPFSQNGNVYQVSVYRDLCVCDVSVILAEANPEKSIDFMVLHNKLAKIIKQEFGTGFTFQARRQIEILSEVVPLLTFDYEYDENMIMVPKTGNTISSTALNELTRQVMSHGSGRIDLNDTESLVPDAPMLDLDHDLFRVCYNLPQKTDALRKVARIVQQFATAHDDHTATHDDMLFYLYNRQFSAIKGFISQAYFIEQNIWESDLSIPEGYDSFDAQVKAIQAANFTKDRTAKGRIEDAVENYTLSGKYERLKRLISGLKSITLIGWVQEDVVPNPYPSGRVMQISLNFPKVEGSYIFGYDSVSDRDFDPSEGNWMAYVRKHGKMHDAYEKTEAKKRGFANINGIYVVKNVIGL